MSTQEQRDQARLWRASHPAPRRRTQSVMIEDTEFIVQLPERGCACHPAMPVERTPDGWACKGCGVQS